MDGNNWRGVFAWCRRLLFLASVIPVPDNLDTFITALQWISRINAIDAICATMAAVCAAYSFVKLSWG